MTAWLVDGGWVSWINVEQERYITTKSSRQVGRGRNQHTETIAHMTWGCLSNPIWLVMDDDVLLKKEVHLTREWMLVMYVSASRIYVEALKPVLMEWFGLGRIKRSVRAGKRSCLGFTKRLWSPQKTQGLLKDIKWYRTYRCWNALLNWNHWTGSLLT